MLMIFTKLGRAEIRRGCIQIQVQDTQSECSLLMLKSVKINRMDYNLNFFVCLFASLLERDTELGIQCGVNRVRHPLYLRITHAKLCFLCASDPLGCQ